MAALASTRTTQLYDRREDRVMLDEVVKINTRGGASPNYNDCFGASLTDPSANRISPYEIFRTVANLRTAREHR